MRFKMDARKKNQLFGGLPLLVHSIQYALANSEIIDTIYVSTYDPTIKRIAFTNGAKAINFERYYCFRKWVDARSKSCFANIDIDTKEDMEYA
jgi:hypothetical protein